MEEKIKPTILDKFLCKFISHKFETTSTVESNVIYTEYITTHFKNCLRCGAKNPRYKDDK